MKTARTSPRKLLIGFGLVAAVLAGGAGASRLDVCGPFTDVPLALCPFITELYDLGITAGTSPTTFSPDASLTRGQAAVFAAKSFDQSVARSSRRAALGQWWTTTPQYALGLAITHVPFIPVEGIVCDGADVWVVGGDKFNNGAVSRIRASDGRLLENWPLSSAYAVLSAMGRVFVSSYGSGGQGLFVIDPAQSPGPLSSVIDLIPVGFSTLAFDGGRIWAAGGGAVDIITPSATSPWPVTEASGVSAAFVLLFDGTHMWALDGLNPGSLMKLDESGNVLQTVGVGADPRFPTFDGANIWVPNLSDDSVTVVQASTGTVLATLTGNGLASPWSAAFDGQRVLVTSLQSRLSLFKAADLSPIGSFDVVLGNSPYQATSDGIHFFFGIAGLNAVGRF